MIKSHHTLSLDVIRHSTAHLMAHAVSLLYPDVQIAIGPVIDNGFYYDFSSEQVLSEQLLPSIEEKMRTLIEADLPIVRHVWSRQKALDYFHERHQSYKIAILQDIDKEDEIIIYQQGDFIDLCRGPHVSSTGVLGAFKLLRVSGAYWRGDATQSMLQRIYGTAWASSKELRAYLHRLEQAKQNDHRLLAQKMDLFHIQEQAPGMIFWHPRGWTLYQTIQQHMRQAMQRYGCLEIKTPQIVDVDLWEQSGHLAQFGQHMFFTQAEDRHYAIKPMSCPCHVQVFKHTLRSYRDLPFRLTEFGNCHRYELSGSLYGLMRTRHFTQDDAHVFCEEQHIESEVTRFIKLLVEVYQNFGFKDMIYRLSTRPEQRIGDEALWDRAEQALEQALDRHNIPWTLSAGEGAFYGPKIEFSLRDCLDRIWQCGTIQVDFSMPQRLGAYYIDREGKKCVPVMLHHAVLGSIERFIGILLEQTGGKLPVWLAPVQVAVLTISEQQTTYATECYHQLLQAGFRVHLDLRNDKIGFKIREYSIHRVPYLLIIGAQEVENNTVMVRTQNGKNLGSMSVDTCLSTLQDAVVHRV